MKQDDYQKQTLTREPEPKTIYLAQLKQVISHFVLRDGSEKSVLLTGEILVEGGTETGSDLSTGVFRRVSLWSDPAEELHGVVALAGPIEAPRYNPEPFSTLKPFEMWLYHSKLRSLPPICTESDATYPPLERTSGRLEWKLVEADESGGRGTLTITLEQVGESGAEFIEKVILPPTDVAFRRVEEQRPYKQTQANSIVACGGSAPAGAGHDCRALFVRFIHLSRAGAPGTNLEPLAQQLIDNACAVWWQKGGIKLVPFVPDGQVHATVEVVNVSAQVYTCPGNPQSVCVALAQELSVGAVSPSPDAVEVYFVDRLSDEPGGGITHLCRTVDAFVILEIEKAWNNKYLLAHELGHVLGLAHPDGGGCPGTAAGAQCSVMVPDTPNSARNPASNFAVVDTLSVPLGSVFVSLNTACGRLADLPQGFFHIIRDFPYDDGSLPSAAAAPFPDWWSFSDVWNSDKKPSFDQITYEDGTPMFAPAHTPLHTEPNASGINNMCVRVRTCESLLAVPPQVDVRFFLAVPGAANERLRPLEKNGGVVPPLPFSGADLPTPGKPQTRSVEWTVPAGLPAHSCVFAVAQSQNQPTPPGLLAIINDPTNSQFNFYSLFNFVAGNNDVAQRNLHIQQVAQSGTASFWSTFGWLSLANPLEQTGAARLLVDASGAATLAGLRLEVNGEIVQHFQPGAVAQVELKGDMHREDLMVIRLQAMIPLNVRPDAAIPITFHFTLDGQPISGYTHLITVAPLSLVTAQVLDVLYAAARDVAAVCGSAPATVVASKIRALAADQHDWEARLREMAAEFSAVAHQLAAADIAGECHVAQQKLLELADLLQHPAADLVQFIEQIRDSADRIQESAGRVVRRDWKPGT